MINHQSQICRWEYKFMHPMYVHEARQLDGGLKRGRCYGGFEYASDKAGPFSEAAEEKSDDMPRPPM